MTVRRKPDRLGAVMAANDATEAYYGPAIVGGLRECSICGAPFDLDTEGGSEGQIGIIPVAFCPTCKAGIYDYVEGTADDREDRHILPGIQDTD